MKNILLIVVDCARTEKTLLDLPGGTAGTRRSARLPFLDRLRARGTTWTGFNAVSSTTTPNFASMFTGLLPTEHGICEHSRFSLRPGLATVAGILRDQGYHTYAECTGPLITEAGLDRGFDHYRYRDRSEYLHTGFRRYLQDLLPTLRRPWFLCLHLWEAHQPYQNPPPFTAEFCGRTPHDRALSLVDAQLDELFGGWDPDRAAIVYTSDHGERLAEDYALNQALGGREKPVLDAYQHFLATQREGFDFDAWFTVLRGKLGENTARIYAHNVLGHGFHLTEDLIRVPLVICDGDRCSPGETREGLRSQVDLGATLLDLAGLPTSELAGGRSLLVGPDPEMVYTEANGSGGKQYATRCYLRGARSHRWKYWRQEVPGNAQPVRRVLWDLRADPRETTDVAGELPERVAELDRFVDRSLAVGTAGSPGAAGIARDPARGQEPDEIKAQRIEEKLRELGYL